MSGGGGDKVKETKSEQTAANIALQRYGRYINTYRPFENQAFADATGIQSADQIERQARGAVAADVASGVNQTARGIDPNRPIEGALDPEGAKRVAGAVVSAEQLGEAFQQQGLEQVTAIGDGQADLAEAGALKDARGALAEEINQAQRDFQRQANTTQAVSQAAGGLAAAGLHQMKPPSSLPKVGPFDWDQTEVGI